VRSAALRSGAACAACLASALTAAAAAAAETQGTLHDALDVRARTWTIYEGVQRHACWWC
jgi:hypothetical protein